MAGKSKSPWDILKSKQDKLDWQNFDLLENLLIFCAMKERNVPEESGVHFRISNPKKDSVCILFQIDRKSDPLIKDKNTPRPDYLVFYRDRSRCLCTIVEMKGRGEKKLGHGVDQITSFRDRLKQELKAHLPDLKIKFQGILLTPPNSQIPLKRIDKEFKNGFVILALQWHHKAELYPYVSKENGISERYRHNNSLKNVKPGFIEQMMVERALHKRINDAFHSANFSQKKNRTGIYINFALSEQDDYAALRADDSKALIAVKQGKINQAEKIRKELKELGIAVNRKIQIELMN